MEKLSTIVENEVKNERKKNKQKKMQQMIVRIVEDRQLLLYVRVSRQ